MLPLSPRRGGYNRWRHPRGFGPLRMEPPSPGEHWSAKVPVPKDAYSLDFVFADAEEGGRCDSRGGLDYHMPAGGAGQEGGAGMHVGRSASRELPAASWEAVGLSD